MLTLAACLTCCPTPNGFSAWICVVLLEFLRKTEVFRPVENCRGHIKIHKCSCGAEMSKTFKLNSFLVEVGDDPFDHGPFSSQLGRAEWSYCQFCVTVTSAKLLLLHITNGTAFPGVRCKVLAYIFFVTVKLDFPIMSFLEHRRANLVIMIQFTRQLFKSCA